MHGRSRFRTRARGSGAALSPFLFQASTYGATDAWDFVNDQYIRGGLLSDGGISITRNSVGTAETADGRIITFGSGVRRQTDKGLLVEGARTNLFLNSLVGETQSITVTAVAHTLSFYGTGTITLSGVSTDGPLVGTGAGQRVTLTFTPTAGSLTLTVSGTVEYVQLEVGAFATSWIPTEGASVARAADVVTAVPTAGTDYPLTLFAEFERVTDTGSDEFILQLDNGTTINRASLRVNSGDSAASVTTFNGSQQSGTAVSGALALNTIYRSAISVETDNVRMASRGLLSGVDTSATNPLTPNRLVFGNNGATSYFNGYVRRVSVFVPFVANSVLQEVTA